MGLEVEAESVIKKVKVAANSIKDPNTKIAILSLTKITENMLKRINDLEMKLYGR
jgi:hypothetical protein